MLSALQFSSAVALLATSLVYAQPAEASIKSRCIKKWDTDYDMIEYCIKKQSSALSSMRRIPSNSIKRSCQSKWGKDFDMVNYCYKKQAGAKKRLGL